MTGWTSRVDDARGVEVRTLVLTDLPRISHRAHRAQHLQLVARQTRRFGAEQWTPVALGIELWAIGRLVPLVNVTLFSDEFAELERAIAEVKQISGSRGASEE